MIKDGPLRRDINRVLDFRGVIKLIDIKREVVDHRYVLAGCLLEIASEHVSSICLLLMFNRVSSSTALLRSCIESAVRGTWVLLVATDQNIEDILAERGADKGWPGLEQLMGAIEGHHRAGGMLRRIFTQTGSLNDFTHGGLMQISRRMAPHVGKEWKDSANRICLHNAVNALSLITGAFHLHAENYLAWVTMIQSSADTVESFEQLG